MGLGDAISSVGDAIGPVTAEMMGLGDAIDAMNIRMSEAQQAGQQLASIFEGVLSAAITSTFAAIGEAIGGGEEAGLRNYIQNIGGLMKQFGSLLIAFGVAQLALFESWKLGPYGAIAAIAAGAILVGVGAAIGAKGSQVSGGAFSGGGGYGSYSGGTFGGAGVYDYNREIVMVARGTDLVAVLDRYGQRSDNGSGSGFGTGG